MLRRAPVSFTIGAICLLLACAGEPVTAGLEWERMAILHGEVWRLLSGHVVHFSLSHAGADALGLIAAGLVAEPLIGSRRFALILGGGALLVSLGLLALAPGLFEYRGASGLAMLAAVLGGVLAWRRHPASRAILACAGLALASKTLWEACAHTAAFTELPAGVAVAWQAHLLGAVLGAWAAHALQSSASGENHVWHRRRT
ncbi:rhombosortase [Massilia norwichensis]|uniref:Rhombosortase n=1 Tax=Massilia norwichensis TaxID=1442366 RepID=A0ABT2A2K6_9BURK|nr:rhombosortase [Massilia norwichensis]MCS0588413.1 rhombosortase [Massilia norwichensis]